MSLAYKCDRCDFIGPLPIPLTIGYDDWETGISTLPEYPLQFCNTCRISFNDWKQNKTKKKEK